MISFTSKEPLIIHSFGMRTEYLFGPTLPEPAPNVPDENPADLDEAEFEKELDEKTRDQP